MNVGNENVAFYLIKIGIIIEEMLALIHRIRYMCDSISSHRSAKAAFKLDKYLANSIIRIVIKYILLRIKLMRIKEFWILINYKYYHLL